MADNKYFNIPDDYDDEIDGALEPIKRLMQNMPTNVPLMIDPKRFSEVNKSIKAIKDIIAEEGYDVEYNIEFDELTGTSLGFDVIVKYTIGTTMIDKFSEALKCANSVEVMGNLEETLTLSIGYRDVRTPIPPAKK